MDADVFDPNQIAVQKFERTKTKGLIGMESIMHLICQRTTKTRQATATALTRCHLLSIVNIDT
jgi:hypothetical protein